MYQKNNFSWENLKMPEIVFLFAFKSFFSMNAFRKAVICFQTFTLLFVVHLDQSHSSELAVDDRFEISAEESEYIVFTDRLERAEAYKVIKLLQEFIAQSLGFTTINHDGIVVFRSFISSFFLINIYLVTLSALAP